nr:hypothetical protein [Lachnospiraceae bacterium]
MRNLEIKENNNDMGVFKKHTSLRRIVALLLVMIMCVTALSACSGSSDERKPFANSTDPFSDNTEIIYDLNKSTVSLGKYLYFVAYYELVAQAMMKSYEQEFGFTGDYFSQKYDDTQTEADHYKSIVEDTVIYYEILKNKALDDGYSLSAEKEEECNVTAQAT